MPQDWGLTPRECEVIAHVVGGLSNRRVARMLGISEKTVKNHLSSIYRKLGARCRVEAILLVLGYDSAASQPDALVMPASSPSGPRPS